MNILQKYEKYFYIIFLVGLIIYFPIFFNGFVWDDIAYILNNTQVHQVNIPVLFGPNLFNDGLFYRPIPAVYFALLYSFAGNNAFLYHLIQLLLHLADSSLLFLFFCLFFSDGIALFLALIFLVHPINVESVAYIGASQSELYFLPGIIALLLSQKNNISQNRLLWITGLLLLSILAKETGFLFVILVLASRYLFRLDKLKDFFISSLTIILIYGVMRVILGSVTASQSTLIPISTLSLPQRLLNVPAIIFYYLKIFILPLQLTIQQTWIVNTLDLQTFIFPLLMCLLFIALACYLAYCLNGHNKEQILPNQKKQKCHMLLKPKQININHLVFFAVWFVIGIGILLQIVPLDMTVADRWFYFPIVGLLGLIGIALQLLLPSIQKKGNIYLYTAVALICLLSLRTFIRTFDWKSELTIFADAKHASSNNYLLDDAYAITLFKSGQHDEAIAYDKQSIAIFPSMQNGYLLGDMYKQLHQDKNSIAAFTEALKYYRPSARPVPPPTPGGMGYEEDVNLIKTYIELTYEYNTNNDPDDTINIITNKALAKFPNDPNLYVNLAIAYYETGNRNQAMLAIAKARALAPGQYTDTIYNQIQNNIRPD